MQHLSTWAPNRQQPATTDNVLFGKFCTSFLKSNLKNHMVMHMVAVVRAPVANLSNARELYKMADLKRQTTEQSEIRSFTKKCQKII